MINNQTNNNTSKDNQDTSNKAKQTNQTPLKPKYPLLVANYKKGYKWASTWAFVLIVFLATTPIPDTLTHYLPEVWQQHLTAIIALCGLVLRFVNQSGYYHHHAPNQNPDEDDTVFMSDEDKTDHSDTNAS